MDGWSVYCVPASEELEIILREHDTRTRPAPQVPEKKYELIGHEIGPNDTGGQYAKPLIVEASQSPAPQVPDNLTDGVLLDLLWWIQTAINNGEIAIQTIIVKERIEHLQKIVKEKRAQHPPAPAQNPALADTVILPRWVFDALTDKSIRLDKQESHEADRIIAALRQQPKEPKA